MKTRSESPLQHSLSINKATLCLQIHNNCFSFSPIHAQMLKWMALECIHYRKFTHQSDVWSYGKGNPLREEFISRYFYIVTCANGMSPRLPDFS